MNLSIKEMFRASWAVFQKHLWVFVGATAILGAISLISDKISKEIGDPLGGIIGIIIMVLLWWLYIGYVRMALTAYSGGMIKINDLYSGKWPMLLQFAIAAVLTGIIVAVGIVLLIVPGIIAQVGLLFGAFFVVDKGMKGIDAMKASWNLTKGHRMDIFWAFLVLILLNFAGLLLVGLGLLVTVPVTALALTHLYRELDKKIQPQVAVPQSMPATQ